MNSDRFPDNYELIIFELVSSLILVHRTIFFWAPMAKWALVIAGLKDLQRPADKLSLNQNLALAATGFIWVSEVEMLRSRCVRPTPKEQGYVL